VNGIDVVLLADAHDVGDVQVRPQRRLALADLVRLVRREAVLGERILGAVDGARADAELGARAEDADGDLAAVGDQELLELGVGRGDLVVQVELVQVATDAVFKFSAHRGRMQAGRVHGQGIAALHDDTRQGVRHGGQRRGVGPWSTAWSTRSKFRVGRSTRVCCALSPCSAA